MAYTRVKLLFVLTLLQLCRAEISNNERSDNLPEWYSANVINDGFQPKSISEIFSTESPPFSSTNPIVVLPKFTSTTVAPPSSIAGDITKTSIIPVSSTPLPDTVSTLPPQTPTDFSSRFPSQTPQVEITQFTEQTHPSTSLQEILSDLRHTSPSLPPYTLDHQTTLQQSTPSILTYSLDHQTTLLQDPSSSPLGRFVVPQKAEPDFSTTLQQSTSPTPEPLPNYFVVYQKTPETLPSLSLPNSLQGGLFGGGPQKSTTVVIQPSTTASPQTNLPGSTFVSSTSERPTTVKRPSRDPTTGKPTTMGLSTPKTTIVDATAGGTHYPARPLPVRIRVVGPRGSITHVNINPPITALALTSTTKRPSATRTRKTPKPKRNSYEACLSGCKVKRDPICAIPLSATWIDADKLKGFPSVCHMACFNSYKKEPYEKILDGRCGRLRTRIQTFDSKTKMTRQELNKAQYTIDNGDHTIVEVSALRHK